MRGKEKFEKRVVISGVGLIGGSIAAAIRKRSPSTEVVGVGRNEVRLQKALDANLLTSFCTTPTVETVHNSIVVVCLPVQYITEDLRRFAKIASEDTVLTDAGSVKAAICHEIATDSTIAKRFVAAHPIAGGEQGGFEHSDADLFVNRNCVLTPNVATEGQNVSRVTAFWKSIGCQILTMSPEEHDRVLALTSHLPHIMAAVTTNVVGPQNLNLTGSGFRDTTRIAAGGPDLWTQILMNNSDSIIQAISEAEHQLSQYREALLCSNEQTVAELLRSASDCRRRLDAPETPGDS